jgi:nucleotide-binding universal stress UspA family protein
MKAMFENVIVGVDGSSSGRDAVALAAQLIDPNGRMTLMHVYQGDLDPLNALAPSARSEAQSASQQLLERERAAAGVEAEIVSNAALSAGRALHEQAERQRADLVVVGSCSRSAVGRAMLGDETRSALNGAPCAVAIAARGFAETPAALARIGVAYNGSPESQAALAVAHVLAASRETTVQALEVVSMPVYGVGLFATPVAGPIDELLAQANRRMAELADVDGRAAYALVPREQLAAFGQDLDLLVVGSRSYGPVRRMMLGSTSDYLERHARCSLLVLPRGPLAVATAGERTATTAVAG